MIRQYRVTLRHDRGTIRIRTAAQSGKSAAETVRLAEGAPLRAVVRVERSR